MPQITLIKASGEREPFREEKLISSLERAGASPKLARDIAKAIRPDLRDGMSTRELYRLAFRRLRKEGGGLAARYNLKQAIFALGPSGFPFERFVSRIFSERGYSVEVGKTLRGRCVTHEVDVVATKDRKHLMVECKFHNQQGFKTNVKTSLYVKARFDDIRDADAPGHEPRIHEGWLVTNTRLTSDAVAYASCSGIRAVGWSHPKSGSLQDMIEESGLHPLTCLTSLSVGQKRQALEQGSVLCRDIERDPDLLSKIGLSVAESGRVLTEIKDVCSGA
ncbi:restriction endonuclease [Candidatus Uhrbacteria bacterium]|nr:restriction endonuclease [Candidatus Uhrbacteria bacterium]